MKVRVRYYDVAKNGRGYWRAPKNAVREGGFPRSIPCGLDGPKAWEVAETWNGRLDAWRQERAGAAASKPPGWPPGSLGEAFDRYQRTEEWALKTDSTRSEWLLSWRFIGPVFGDVVPATVTLEQVSACYPAVLAQKGIDTTGA